jgi:PAS domain S-box-containing protein
VPVTEPSIHFRGTLGIARDITEHHHLINQLKQFKSFADNSAQGFAMATLDGNITYFNEKIRTMLGVKDEINESSLGSLNYLEFYPDVSQKFLQETVIPYLKEYDVWEGELEARSRDGRVFSTYETYFILRDESGRATSFGNIMSDITEQKHVSIQLEQTKEAAEQANQAKSQFLANMSHEIRTPLNAIIGYAQLIGEDNQLTGVSRTRFLSIASAGDRLLGLINGILDIARIESGRLVLHEQKINLCKEVSQIGKMLQGMAHEKGLILSV